MQFLSDNAGRAHPRVMEALAKANEDYALAYGGDSLTETARQYVRDVLDAPEARVEFVTSGTAANAILLSELTPPWGSVFAAKTSHIEEDECGAVALMSGGAKITLVDGSDGKMDVDALGAAVAQYGGRDPHNWAVGPISVTQATEKGTLYSEVEIAAHAAIARSAGAALHMDGARFANAVAAGGGSPAALSWRAGVDALSFGGTKNGALGVEAMVVFDPSNTPNLDRRQMRSGHLLSKTRYLAAQMLALLEDDLWLDLAGRANRAAARLTTGLKQKPDFELLYEPEANIVFGNLPAGLHRQLVAQGAAYHVWDGDPEGADDAQITVRLVCDWSIEDAQIDAFLDLI